MTDTPTPNTPSEPGEPDLPDGDPDDLDCPDDLGLGQSDSREPRDVTTSAPLEHPEVSRHGTGRPEGTTEYLDRPDATAEQLARRVPFDPDQPPFDQLPLIRARTSGRVDVVRGTLDLDAFPDLFLTWAREQPGVDHAVFINRLDQCDIYARGQLVAPDLDLTRIGYRPYGHDSEFLRAIGEEHHPLPDIVTRMRAMSDWYADIADTYQQLIDTGWVSAPAVAAHAGPGLRIDADLVDTGNNGPSYAPGWTTRSGDSSDTSAHSDDPDA